MRDTIDFGIDLGTTNSAIAVADRGAATIIKNFDGSDTTPSAVWLPKPGRVHVGRAAKEHVVSDPADAAAEFKLEMGLADAARHFARAGVSLTPPELSAEVLKTLCTDAASLFEAPTSAVITVPAAFALHQTGATQQAAELAHLTGCPLLQEPTAAAFAYGADRDDDRGYWMVFDFGGGTFDAAIVTRRDGELQVLNHAGDPFLGGKLIDWALVEKVLLPAAARDLGLGEVRRDDPAMAKVFARLKGVAEDAKIALSRQDRVEIDRELELPSGDKEWFECTVTRDQLDALAEPFYQRAVDRCRAALTEGGLGPDDVDVLLLVGGTTLAPGLRERLADPGTGLGIPIDHSQDPTTVVARGAALFAGTIRAAPAPRRAPVSGEFHVEFAYDPTTTSTSPTVGGRLSSGGVEDWTGWTVVLDAPEARPPFRTPAVALNARGSFLTEVQLGAGESVRYTLLLTDPGGRAVPATPEGLTITHTDLEFGGAVLTQSLGIARADESFAPLVRKGSALPAHARGTFRTTVSLRRDEPDGLIRVPVVEGERPRADRNREVGVIEMRPRDVRIDLPAGSEVEVTLEVDESRLVSVTVDVPVLDTFFDAEMRLDDVRAPDVAALEQRYREAESRAQHLRSASATSEAGEAGRLLDDLDERRDLETARDQVRAARSDAGAAATADARLREVLAELDRVEEAVALPALVRELDDALADTSSLVDARGRAEDRRELEDVRTRAERERGDPDAARIRALVERLRRLTVRLLREGPEWQLTVFHALCEARGRMTSTDQAERAIRDGEQAIAAGDERALAGVNERLRRLLPADVRREGGLE